MLRPTTVRSHSAKVSKFKHLILLHLDEFSLLLGFSVTFLGAAFFFDAMHIELLKQIFAAIALLFLFYKIKRLCFPCNCGLVLQESFIDPPLLRNKIAVTGVIGSIALTLILMILIFSRFSGGILFGSVFVFWCSGLMLLISGFRGYAFQFASRLRILTRKKTEVQDFSTMSLDALNQLISVALDSGELEKADAISQVILQQAEIELLEDRET